MNAVPGPLDRVMSRNHDCPDAIGVLRWCEVGIVSPSRITLAVGHLGCSRCANPRPVRFMAQTARAAARDQCYTCYENEKPAKLHNHISPSEFTNKLVALKFTPSI